MISKIKENKNIIILIFIIIVGSLWLIKDGIIVSDDATFHVGRVQGLANSIKTGDFLAYIHNTYYGYASGLFYSNFFIYLPAILNVTGLDNISSLKVLYFLINIFTTLTIFFSLKSITYNNKTAIFGTILYMFTNYRIVDIFLRAALGEMLAFMVIPIVILGLYEIIYRDYKKWYIFSIGFVLLLLSHLISTILLAFFILIIILINIKKLINEKQRIKYLLISGAVGLLLGGFFFFPIIEQKFFGNIEIFINKSYYLPQDNSFSFKELFIEKNNVVLGLSLLFLFPLRFFIKETDNKELLKFADCLFVLALIAWFSITDIFPWKLLGNTLHFIQFPWRLLIISTTFLAIAFSIYFLLINNNKMKYLIFFTTCVLSFGNIIRYYSYVANNHEVHYSLNPNSLEYKEYLPANTDPIKLEEMNHYMVFNKDELLITNYKKIGNIISFEYMNNNNLDTYVEVPLFNYLGYYSDDAEISTGNNNVIRLHLTKKSGKVEVYYSGTLIQKISLFVSIITLFAIIFYILKKSLSKRRKNEIYE